MCSCNQCFAMFVFIQVMSFLCCDDVSQVTLYPYAYTWYVVVLCEVVGLPNNSCKPITNTASVRVRLCKLQKKGCTRLTTASDKVYQLLAHGQWFSPGTPASSTTKTGRHDIAEILLKVALNTINQIKSLYVCIHASSFIRMCHSICCHISVHFVYDVMYLCCFIIVVLIKIAVFTMY